MMTLALAEAEHGRPSPNPRVGAVIVKNERVVATGFHERAGQAHAEVIAIQRANADVKDATLYVTLEPCNHHGRTGPCTDAILQAGITRVVIGCCDPMPHVPGAIAKLQAGGLQVEVGLLESRAKHLIAAFVKHRQTGMPYVVLKAAVSLDGKIASRSGDARWLTGNKARAQAHVLRSLADAVLVGVSTVLQDDPLLTVRHIKGPQPTRIVLDSKLRTPPTAKLFHGFDAPAVWIVHAQDAPPAKKAALSSAGAQLFEVPQGEHGLELKAVLELLASKEIMGILVEGGAAVYNSFLRAGMVDRLAIFVAPLLIGDASAPSLAAFREVSQLTQASRLSDLRVRRLGSDVLFEGNILESLS